MTTLQNESLQGIKEYADDYELDLSWLDTRGEWGIKAEPDAKRGMTLSSVEVGSYGEAPDTTDNMTGRPRGAGLRQARRGPCRRDDEHQCREGRRDR